MLEVRGSIDNRQARGAPFSRTEGLNPGLERALVVLDRYCPFLNA